MTWFALLLLFAGAFWEDKPPKEWSDVELRALLTESPWAHMAGATASSGTQPVVMYLATAGPMEKAEAERDRRAKLKKPTSEPDEMAAEYRAWLDENRATQIVLAIRVGNPSEYSQEKETHQMEEESVMRVGRRKFKMTGHFPPSANDPYLRLAFPREVKPADKTVTFELYVPGVAIPFRSVEFTVKDLMVSGKLEI
jgi:hypothetical protein